MRSILVYSILVLSAALPAPVAGQGIASATVSGSSANVSVSLPGSLGADVTVSFEDVSGLSRANLGISAQVINPGDPTLLARLPGGSAPAGGFPVLLRIEPPVTGSLSFTGIVTLKIHTHNLQYAIGSPLRIFSAPLGGPFHDITVNIGDGSYRARGTTGGFSEFLIVSETRTVDQVIAAKFDRLEEALETYEGSMSAPLYGDLSELLQSARTHYSQGDLRQAAEDVDQLAGVVQQQSGTAIPDVWRSARDVQNVAGYLRAAAMTLRFSLILKRSLGL
jgi:hypothetical protein